MVKLIYKQFEAAASTTRFEMTLRAQSGDSTPLQDRANNSQTLRS